MVTIKYCGCKTGPASDFQDITYGKGMRVCNDGNKGSKCTVCGTIKK